MRKWGRRARKMLGERDVDTRKGTSEHIQDPILILGSDLGSYVFGKLEPRHLLKVTLVSRRWRALSAPDSPLWEKACMKLWSNPSKVYNPAAGDKSLSWKSRYLRSDAERKRKKLTFSELTTFEWKFRFKRTAGSWWMEVDPYWINGKDESKMMKRRFAMDGTFQAIGDTDPLMSPEEVMSWRFVGDNGAVQVEDYPPLKCRRLSDWGFCLENQWVLMIADLPIDGPHAVGVKPAF